MASSITSSSTSRDNPLICSSGSTPNSRPSTDARLRVREHSFERRLTPQPDDLSDALCDRPLPVRRVGVVQPAFGRGQTRDFAEEEWVPFGLSVDGRNNIHWRAIAGDGLDVPSDIRRFEATQMKTPGRRVPDQFGEGRRQRVVAVDLDISVRPDHEKSRL